MATESERGKRSAVISKETFSKALELMKEQESVNEKVSKTLNLVGNGHFAFSGGAQYYEALMLVLKKLLATGMTTSAGGSMRAHPIT